MCQVLNSKKSDAVKRVSEPFIGAIRKMKHLSNSEGETIRGIAENNLWECSGLTEQRCRRGATFFVLRDIDCVTSLCNLHCLGKRRLVLVQRPVNHYHGGSGVSVVLPPIRLL